ncbi:MAG: AraC family transcriptional regulator [Acidimicrobiia bacterium]|nr:AraC family transcriptional regulator [Acidimicrobiia bacterium]
MTSTFLLHTSEALAEVMATIRVSGAVLSLAHLEAPFTVASGEVSTGVFHAVLDGEAWATLVAGGEAVHLRAGQVAVFPSGAAHVIASNPEPRTAPVPVSAGGDGPLPTMHVAGDGPTTRILCGTITFEDSPVFTVADTLPDMVVTGSEASPDWVHSTVELIADELSSDIPASRVVAERLADVLVVRTLREIVGTGLGAGWAAGLRDVQLASALAAFHRDPGSTWTVAALADAASMSRSSFYERFTTVVGSAPGAYVTRWRIHLACGRLRSGESVSMAGRAVGFATDAGFSTTFKRLIGMTPSAYKRSA